MVWWVRRGVFVSSEKKEGGGYRARQK